MTAKYGPSTREMRDRLLVRIRPLCECSLSDFQALANAVATYRDKLENYDEDFVVAYRDRETVTAADELQMLNLVWRAVKHAYYDDPELEAVSA